MILLIQMNIYYWAPFITHVATVDAVKNSAMSLSLFSKKKLNPIIINSVGEWTAHEKLNKENGIKTLDLTKSENFYNKLPRGGFVKSRIAYFMIILKTFKKLHFFLKQKQINDIIILHLLVSLPLILNFFFKYKCKFVLRISGFPKLNIFRKYLWKLSNRNIDFITCPTVGTKNDLVKKKIFNQSKVYVLRDPVIIISQFIKKFKASKNKKLDLNYILCIGRLTEQKNFQFVIKNFIKILGLDPDISLVILGSGENEYQLKKLVKNLKLTDKIHFVSFQKNIYQYLKHAKCFILSSKWEDPGFVLLEAAISRVPIISSNCKNGPKEILSNSEGGYLYKVNDDSDFIKKYEIFLEDMRKQPNNVNKKIKKTFRIVRDFTIFNHFKTLEKIIRKSNEKNIN